MTQSRAPGANTFVRLGAPNDPPSENDDYTKTGGESFKETGYLVSTEGPFELRIGGIKLELILGGADFSIAGVANRFEFTGGAKEDILLGGKVDIHVPTKWEYSHSKADVDFEEFKASNNTVIATLATRTDLTDVTTRVTNTETSIHNTETAVRNLTTDLTNAQTNLHNEVVEAKNQVTQAVNNKMHAAATALRSVGTTLQTTGVQLGEAGTYIENHGAKIQTAGTHIKSAGSSIASSSIAIRDAAAILDA